MLWPVSNVVFHFSTCAKAGQSPSKQVTSIPYNPTGQAVVERLNHTLIEILIKQKGDVRSLRDRLNNAVLTLNILNVSETGSTADEITGV